MRLRVPKQWNVFSQGKPGHRFQDRYRANRRDRASQGILRRLQRILLAMVATAVGIVLVFIPGPAILFFFLAGALLASDWLWMARTLDWLEVKLRAWGRHAKKIWRQLPTAGRAALIAAGGCLSMATMYGAYRVMQ
jgi:hypothetical protein